MPPKGRGTAIGGPRPAPRGGFARDTYNWVTSADNRSVVTSLAFFAVRMDTGGIIHVMEADGLDREVLHF